MKLKSCKEIDYIVPVPKRFKSKDCRECMVRVIFRDGEYQYQPRVFTWRNDIALCIDELEAIIDELKRLNKEDK